MPPTHDLLQAVAGIVNNHLQGYDFDPDLESFFVRGPNLFYHADKPVVHAPRVMIDVDLTTGDIHSGAVVKGVDIARLMPEFVSRR